MKISKGNCTIAIIIFLLCTAACGVLGLQKAAAAEAEAIITAASRQIIPFEQESTKTDFISLLLGQILPYTPTQTAEEPTDDEKNNELFLNYAAGDESVFYWNRIDQNGELIPKVGIYCTHSAETYTAFAGQAKVTGSRGGVYVAASVIAESLAQKDIGTVIDDTIHDYPDWSLSYTNSCTTASRMLSKYKDLEILIDLHRDAGVPRESSICEINGQTAARIMLVVGSNARQEHPNWEQNKAFSEMIGAKMEEMYPGLLRTVKVQNGRYNQHLSTNAILVEMGTTANTIEEVEYSAQLLANVLAAVIKEQN